MAPSSLAQGIAGVIVYESDVAMAGCEADCGYSSVELAVFVLEESVLDSVAATEALDRHEWVADEVLDIHGAYEYPLAVGHFRVCAEQVPYDPSISCVAFTLDLGEVYTVSQYRGFGVRLIGVNNQTGEPLPVLFLTRPN